MAEPRERRPPQSTPAAGAMPEDQELAQYIHSFTVSSDRVRHIVVVAVVASVMAFAAQWNAISRISWWRFRIDEARIAVRNELWREPEARLARCRAAGPQAAQLVDPCDRVARTLEWVRGSTHGKTSLEAHLAELEKARVSEILMVSVPFLGIRFDVNDLAAFSAIGLGIISLMLLFAMARQHENLFLSLWKVRRVADKENRYDDGESKANFLYHALAMAQVFTRPPTLAREHPRTHGRVAIAFLFLAPLLVQLFIMSDAVRTLRLGGMLSPTSTALSLGLQLPLTAVIAVSTIACWLYSRAGDVRWRETFFAINPALRDLDRSPWVEWVRMAEPPRWHFAADDTAAVYFGDPADSFGRRAGAWMVWKITGLADGDCRLEAIRAPAVLPVPRGIQGPDGSRYFFAPAEGDPGSSLLGRIDGDGTVHPMAGGFSRRVGAAVRVPGEAVCVVDGPRVRRVAPDGVVTDLGGAPLGGFRRSRWPRLLGLALDGDRLLVADYDYACVRTLGLDGGGLDVRYRSPRTWSPAGIVVGDEWIFVLEHRRLSVVGTLLGKVAPLARIVRIPRDRARQPVAERLLWRSPSSRAVLSRRWWLALA